MESGASDGAGEDVLVVDDSASVRAAVRARLEPLGFRVRMASSGEQAYELAVACPPRLVITDVRMKGLSGVHLCRLLRSDPELASIPIVLLTFANDPKSRFWGRHAGADAYVTKENALAGLLPTVQALRDRPAAPGPRPRGRTEMPEPSLRLGEILDELLFDAAIADLVRGWMAHVESDDALLVAIADTLVDVVDGAFVVLELGEHGGDGAVVLREGSRRTSKRTQSSLRSA
jgi:CheY-like chemotaxis protein